MLQEYIKEVYAKPFDFTKNETLELDPEKRTFPKDENELKELLDKIKVPIVIDADAINIISGDAKLISKIKNRKDILLTPHPGEMARLCKTNSETIQSKRLRLLEDFCKDKKFSLPLLGKISKCFNHISTEEDIHP